MDCSVSCECHCWVTSLSNHRINKCVFVFDSRYKYWAGPWLLLHFWPTVLSVASLVQCVVCLSSVVCDVLYCGETVRFS